jgi:probable phosphoglycerate mutase
MNKELWLPIKIREDVKEICFGDLEGMSDEYNDTHFADFKVKQMDMLEDVPYPGGENGTNVFERSMPVINELVRCGKKNIAIVTHGGVIRALLAELFGKDQARRNLFAVSLENTSITQLVYQPERDRFYLQRFNDYAHLEGHPELYRKHL